MSNPLLSSISSQTENTSDGGHDTMTKLVAVSELQTTGLANAKEEKVINHGRIQREKKRYKQALERALETNGKDGKDYQYGFHWIPPHIWEDALKKQTTMHQAMEQLNQEARDEIYKNPKPVGELVPEDHYYFNARCKRTILAINAGCGKTEMWFHKLYFNYFNLILTDIVDSWVEKGVHQFSAEDAVKNFTYDILFVFWPHFDALGYNSVVKNIKPRCRYVVFFGEDSIYGCCDPGDVFLDSLYDKFERVDICTSTFLTQSVSFSLFERKTHQ